VIIQLGYVYVNLDFSQVNESMLPVGCFANGIQWHVHDAWTYSVPDEKFNTSCAKTYTGNHFDPWLACGAYSDEANCKSQGGCVNKSSAWDPVADVDQCTPANFELVPYACEVGDLSGKYGKWYPSQSNNYTIISEFASFWESTADNIVGTNGADDRSLVLHCGTPSPQRMWCTQFVKDTNSFTPNPLIGDQTISIPFEDEDNNVGYPNFEMKATANGYTIIWPQSLQNECPSGFQVYLYDSWKSDIETVAIDNDCNEDLIGHIWDPTISCITDSSSDYCYYNDTESIMYRCTGNDSTAVTYVCDNINTESKAFGCAVGDISGRIGIIKYCVVDSSPATLYQTATMVTVNDTTGNSFSACQIEATDSLSPPVYSIAEKAIKLVCMSNTTKVICAITKQTNGTIVTDSPLIPSTTAGPSPSTTTTNNNDNAHQIFSFVMLIMAIMIGIFIQKKMKKKNV